MPTLQDCDDTGPDFRDLKAQLKARRYSTGRNARRCHRREQHNIKICMYEYGSLQQIYLHRYIISILGTRYNTRGIDDNGNVANFVEVPLLSWIQKTA
jgi:hypothetical protein